MPDVMTFVSVARPKDVHWMSYLSSLSSWGVLVHRQFVTSVPAKLRSISSCFQWCDWCWLTNTSMRLSCVSGAEGPAKGIDVDKRVVVQCLLPQLVQFLRAQSDQVQHLECYMSVRDVHAEVSEVFWIDVVKVSDAWKDVLHEGKEDSATVSLASLSTDMTVAKQPKQRRFPQGLPWTHRAAALWYTDGEIVIESAALSE
eukprot:5720181-Amphidinium_carterae.2